MQSDEFQIVAPHEDTPTMAKGVLIPGVSHATPRLATPVLRKQTVPKKKAATERPGLLLLASVLMFALSIGSTGYAVMSGSQLAAAPIVYVASSEQYEPVPFQYGAQVSFSQPDFFNDTLVSFKEQGTSFIAADLTAMKIYYYENGDIAFEAPILAKGKEGSWWETPAGLYAVELKTKNHFSSFGQVYQPWSMVFQGNFFIHGWPYYPDGTEVPAGYSGGCIRLATEDARQLYHLVSTNTPVLVYEEEFTNDGFAYEPKVPELEADQYLVADIKNSTVLAASDIDSQAPIASITKLMTALIAAEYINLDKRAKISEDLLVRSIIPRLQSANTASMYSLLQLLLVESSNEAAEVIAAQVGRERFISLMNDKAASLGLHDTMFADVSGLSKDNVSTTGDLLRLIQYIYNNRSFILELTANQNLPTAYSAGEFGVLVNYNQIEDIDNFIGGKVGETLAARQTSVSLHTYLIDDQERIVAVIVLGSDNRERDIKILLEYYEDRFVE